jgi:DNA-binding NtrC family response regulator
LPVLITGETGVGKENAAFAVHFWSKRSAGPFVVLDCSAIPPTLIESQLFGHEKGAFTGAHAARPGVFEQARGGTVFLDEIGELPLEMQPRLLRALEERVIRRVGASEPTQLDIRLVAATNRSLDDECRAGRFRQDLLYRLQGARVILPPLRDRKCEIPILAHELLAQACTRDGRPPIEITPAAMQVLLTHDWTGNVRELRQAMDFAAVAAPDAFVEPSDLPPHITGAPTAISASMPVVASPTDVTADVPIDVSFRPVADELRELEKRRMVEALAATGGVKSRAAQLIDMPIRTFTLKAKQYKI